MDLSQFVDFFYAEILYSPTISLPKRALPHDDFLLEFCFVILHSLLTISEMCLCARIGLPFLPLLCSLRFYLHRWAGPSHMVPHRVEGIHTALCMSANGTLGVWGYPALQFWVAIFPTVKHFTVLDRYLLFVNVFYSLFFSFLLFWLRISKRYYNILYPNLTFTYGFNFFLDQAPRLFLELKILLVSNILTFNLHFFYLISQSICKDPCYRLRFTMFYI